MIFSLQDENVVAIEIAIASATQTQTQTQTQCKCKVTTWVYLPGYIVYPVSGGQYPGSSKFNHGATLTVQLCMSCTYMGHGAGTSYS